MKQGSGKHLDMHLSHDQHDDLVSALESHRNYFEDLAASSVNGFGLDTAYWNGRVEEIQQLLQAVRDLADEPGGVEAGEAASEGE